MSEDAIVSKLIYSYACKISPIRVMLRLTIVFSRLLIAVTVESKLHFSFFCTGVLFAEGQYTEIQGAESLSILEAIVTFFGYVYNLTLKVLTFLEDL